MTFVIALCFFVSIVMLITISNKTPREMALGIALIGAALASYLTTHRTITAEDDALNYHEIFLAVGVNDWSLIDNLGGGFEVALPVFLKLTYIFFGELKLKEFIFFITFASTSAVIATYYWLIPKVSGKDHYALKLAFSLVFVSFFSASHTTRQFIAGILLLPILALQLTRWQMLIFSTGATLFHLTSLFYVMFIQICRSRAFFLLVLPLVFIALGNTEGFSEILVNSMPDIFKSKLILLSLGDKSAEDVSSLPEVVKLVSLAVLVAVSNTIYADSVPIHARRFVYLSVIVAIIFVGVPFINSRFNHFLLNVAFGLLTMMSLQRCVVCMRVVALVAGVYQTRLLLSYV